METTPCPERGCRSVRRLLFGFDTAVISGTTGELESLGNDSNTVDTEIQEIQASLELEHHSVSELLFRTAYRKPILLAVAIAMFNQLSGINAVMYYAPQNFTMAGTPRCCKQLPWAES